MRAPAIEGSAPPSRREINRLVDEVIQGVQCLLVRCGYSPKELAVRFSRQLKRIPASVRKEGMRAANDYVDVPHVISLWVNKEPYLTDKGEARNLPARGPAPSIESLAAQVDPSLKIDAVMKALRRSDAIVKEGRLYRPKSRVCSYRNDPINLRAHSLRSAKGLLRTLNHNIHVRPDAVRWFQYITENPNIPVHEAEQIYAALFTQGERYLESIDDRYVQGQNRGTRARPGKRVAWQLHYWEENEKKTSRRDRPARRRK